MRDILNHFKIGDTWYRHEIDQDTDATHFISEVPGAPGNEVLRVDANAKVYLPPSRAVFGTFQIYATGLWEFAFADGVTIETPNKDLIKAEMRVFKQLVEDGRLLVAKEDCPASDKWNCKYCDQVSSCDLHSVPKPILGYELGTWFKANSVDEMQQFYMSRLPAIRAVARELGYAIGLHGSTRRDLDLIALPWTEDAADKNTLAHAIAVAACGISREGDYVWTPKPLGRLAVSIPICHTDGDNRRNAGHIDLSVMGTT